MSFPGFIDIHTHILPSVDDGPDEIEESIRMAERMAAAGVKIAVATPHKLPGTYDATRREVDKRLKELRDALEERGIDLQVLPGRECYLGPELLDYLQEGKREEITLAGTRYVLVELPFHEIPLYADDLLSKLQFNGLTPIIAHPERNSVIARDPNLLEEHIGKGRLFQVNASSLLGRYGKKTRRIAEILVKHRFAHLVASDMHSSKSAPLPQAYERAVKLVGEREAMRLFYENPLAVIGNRRITPPTPIRYKPKRGISKLFSIFKRGSG